MIEVFTTNIADNKTAKHIIKILKMKYPNSKIHFDMENEIINYPCTHSILRFEDEHTPSILIQEIIKLEGYSCDILQDKKCISK